MCPTRKTLGAVLIVLCCSILQAETLTGYVLGIRVNANMYRTSWPRKNCTKDQMPLDLQRTPSCMGCVHHYVTHDPVFRYGCKAFGFKSQKSPIYVVQEASAQQCRFFEQRKLTNR